MNSIWTDDLIFEEDEDKYPNHSQNNAKKEKIFKVFMIIF